MSAVTAIAKREIRSFFNSPTPSSRFLLSRYFYFNTLFLVGQASLRESSTWRLCFCGVRTGIDHALAEERKAAPSSAADRAD